MGAAEIPYITKERRSAIEVLGETPTTAGELNFGLTKLVLRYLRLKGKSYMTFNDIVGALEQAKNEFQRRIVHPYEDLKIEENGDVYDL